MLYDKDTARKVAELLLTTKAVKLSPQDPYTWASGWKSPIYCDNRITLSYPNVRTHIRQALFKAIDAKFGKVDVIAGVATGAIAQGVLVAQDFGLPFIYVRPEPKGHGLQNLIEGKLDPDQTVVIVEDLVSTGGSSIKAIEAVRAAGGNVKGMISVFTYGFDVATQATEKAGLNYISLCDYETLLEVAVENNYVTPADIETLKEWRIAPAEWGK